MRRQASIAELVRLLSGSVHRWRAGPVAHPRRSTV